MFNTCLSRRRIQHGKFSISDRSPALYGRDQSPELLNLIDVSVVQEISRRDSLLLRISGIGNLAKCRTGLGQPEVVSARKAEAKVAHPHWMFLLLSPLLYNLFWVVLFG